MEKGVLARGPRPAASHLMGGEINGGARVFQKTTSRGSMDSSLELSSSELVRQVPGGVWPEEAAQRRRRLCFLGANPSRAGEAGRPAREHKLVLRVPTLVNQ